MKLAGWRCFVALALSVLVAATPVGSVAAQQSRPIDAACAAKSPGSDRAFEFLTETNQRLYLKLELDVDQLISRLLRQTSADIRQKMIEGDLIGHRRSIEEGRLSVELASRFHSPEHMEDAERRIREVIPKRQVFFFGYPMLNIERIGDIAFALSVTDKAKADLIVEGQQRAITIIKRRIDPDGAHQVSIRALEGGQIEIIAPPVDSMEGLRETLTRQGDVYFAMAKTDAEGPPNTTWKLLPQFGEYPGCLWVNATNPVVTSQDIGEASHSFDEYGRPQINFTLQQSGVQKFSQATLQNPNQFFAIVLDGEIMSAPRINDPIFGAGVRITGDFTLEEAQRLAAIIDGGELPASLSIVEERLLSASDSPETD